MVATELCAQDLFSFFSPILYYSWERIFLLQSFPKSVGSVFLYLCALLSMLSCTGWPRFKKSHYWWPAHHSSVHCGPSNVQLGELPGINRWLSQCVWRVSRLQYVDLNIFGFVFLKGDHILRAQWVTGGVLGHSNFHMCFCVFCSLGEDNCGRAISFCSHSIMVRG